MRDRWAPLLCLGGSPLRLARQNIPSPTIPSFGGSIRGITWPIGEWGAPFSTGRLRLGSGAAFRGLVIAFLRPCELRFRLLLLRSLGFAFLSAISRFRWYRFAFLALRLALGLLAVAAVSLRQFLILPFGVGFSYVRRFRVCVMLFVCGIQRPLF